MADVTIIQAQPGFTIIYADEGELFRGEPVIAWGIDADRPKKGELPATVYPITPDGQPSGDYVGIENPNKTVSMLDEFFDSFEAAQKRRRDMLKAATKK